MATAVALPYAGELARQEAPAPTVALSPLDVRAGLVSGLLAWGEAHGWPRLALAYSAANFAGYRVPFLHVMAGAGAWHIFTEGASLDHLSMAARAAGLAVPVVLDAIPSPDPRGIEGHASASRQEGTQEGEAPADAFAGIEGPGAWPETFAALDTEGLYVARIGASRQEGTQEGEAPADAFAGIEALPLDDLSRPDGATARRLLALMEREHITQLWLHPSWAAAAGLPSRALTQEQAHTGLAHPFAAWPADIEAPGAWGMLKPGHIRPWLKFYRKGTAGTIALALPHLEARARWREAPDARGLLAAVLTFREAMGHGFTYRTGPGATATALLRVVHRGNRTSLDLSASLATPGDYPAPAREPGLTPQYGWLRPLTEDEQARGAYVHGYDKNAMFLAACNNLRLGFGTPEHIEAPAWDKRRIGYWLARVTFTEASAWAGLLPHPCERPGVSDPGAEWAWYHTATLTLAAEEGATIEAREAWLWGELHQPMQPWYQRLRTARATLQDRAAGQERTAPAALARDALKSVYTQGIGWLDASWLRGADSTDDLYRPDWRHAIIATANANLWRNLAKEWRASGRAPFALSTDCAYYVGASPDPLDPAPAALALGSGPGQYKVNLAGMPAGLLAPAWEALAKGRPSGYALSVFTRRAADWKQGEGA